MSTTPDNPTPTAALIDEARKITAWMRCAPLPITTPIKDEALVVEQLADALETAAKERAQVEADAAALRVALEYVRPYCKAKYGMPNDIEERLDAALANPAGRALLDEVERLRTELEQTRENLYARLDRDHDDTTTPHLAVVAGNALSRARERAEKAEADLAKWQEKHAIAVREIDRTLDRANKSETAWIECQRALAAAKRDSEHLRWLCRCALAYGLDGADSYNVLEACKVGDEMRAAMQPKAGEGK